jgi:glycolate oxidase
MAYAKIDENTIASLQEIVGPESVITDPDALENYSHDETPLYKAMPEAAVKPTSTEQVAAIMKLACKENIPVTPRGGGTCLSAGAVPIHGGIVLSLEKMNKIREIDKDNMMVVVETGVITEQFGKELAQHGLFFPPDPVSLDSCTIGGNIAECAGGPRAMKYGVTRNYVTGIIAVFPDGTVSEMGGKLLKNVTGYDLINLIIGSEGTLAIVTEAIIKVLPLPKVIVDLLIPFVCVEDATNFAVDILQNNTIPAAIEFMDGDVVRMVGKFLERKIPYMEANAHTIVEIDGDERNRVRQVYERIGDTALKYGALDVLVGEGPRDRDKLWEPRKKIGDTLKELTKNITREDLVVPKKQIPQLISKLKNCVQKYGATIYCFGHLGDGNIHADVSIGKAEEISDSKIDRLRREIYGIAVSLGGTITAEHGVGLSKIPYIGIALDDKQIDLMRRIKEVFDPKNILNPGKIFPDQRSG